MIDDNVLLSIPTNSLFLPSQLTFRLQSSGQIAKMVLNSVEMMTFSLYLSINRDVALMESHYYLLLLLYGGN